MTIWLEHARSIRRRDWQDICRRAPRTFRVGKGTVHARWHPDGLMVYAAGDVQEAELFTAAKALTDGLDAQLTAPALWVWSRYGQCCN